MSTKVFLISIIFFLAFCQIQAVEVKTIKVDNYEEFQKGEFQGTSLEGKGNLTMGPKVKKLEGLGKEFYLSLASTPGGDIFVGTGHSASVFRIHANGRDEIFQSDYLDVYALHARKNGDIFVGTSPNGKIYKIPSGKQFIIKNSSEISEIKDKKPQKVKEADRKKIEIFNPDEKFIWDITEDLAGNLIVAVGNDGGVYKITKDGNSTKIFTAEDAHITSLYVTRNNSILAGSGDRGILYKIDNRKVKVLFDSQLEEIKGICEDKEGNIFFSVSKGILDKTREEDKSLEFQPFFKNKKKKPEAKILEKGILYCLHTNGTIERVWSSREEYIYSIFYDQSLDRVIFGTGNFGRVYSVGKDGSFSMIFESDSAQVFKVANNNKGFTLISNNTASIVNIEKDTNSKGTYFSKVFDMGIQSRLGKIYWDAESLTPKDINLYVRSGNSNIPDNTWTDWSAPFSDSENSSINSSRTRYIQVKVVLTSSTMGKSPFLSNFRIYYVQANLSPQIKKISIKKSNHKKQIKNDSKETKNIAKGLRLTWTAIDPNRDKLKYDLWLKKKSNKNWILVKENLLETKFDLESELYEDGKYELKIHVDDSLANPPSTAKSSAKISPTFILDSTAPIIRNFSKINKVISFNVNDATSIISYVYYSLDGTMWLPLFPKDMINDSKNESFSFTLNPRGKYMQKNTIFIKVVDEFNNYKVFQREI